MRAIFNKEFRSYFTTATGYVFMAVFLLISGIFFALTNLLGGSPYYTDVLQSITFIFLILVPMLTMRTLADEKHQKTDQLLFTSPLKFSQIILGKYFAAVSLFLVTLLITCLYPLLMVLYGQVAVWEIVGGYVGFALMGAAFIAVGLFISSLTESQVTSAVGTFGALLVIWLIEWLRQGLPTSLTAGVVFAAVLAILLGVIVYYATRSIYAGGIVALAGGIAIAAIYIIKKELFEGFTANVLGWFSLLNRYDKFSMGLFDVSSIIYYITFSAAFVFLTIRMVDKRRWS